MNLGFVREECQAYSKAASESSRRLALAGIAIVWLLADKNTNVILNYVPLWFFLACLCAEFIQYIYGYVSWLVLDTFKERQLKNRHPDDWEKVEEEDFEAPFWMNYPTNLFFLLKVISVAVGYGYLFVEITNKIKG